MVNGMRAFINRAIKTLTFLAVSVCESAHVKDLPRYVVAKLSSEWFFTSGQFSEVGSA